MNRYPPYQPLHPPTGPAAMILPSVILGLLGLLALGGGQEAMRSSVLLGSLYCAGGLLIFSFLAFCLALHIRAQRLWDWHVRTRQMPISESTASSRARCSGEEWAW